MVPGINDISHNAWSEIMDIVGPGLVPETWLIFNQSD
jgi:hypothetical protein